MRFARLFFLMLSACGMAAAQNAATNPPPSPADGRSQRSAQGRAGDRATQRIERIRVEDAGNTVEELRYGGQTQSITVQPKADMPAYEILPEGGTHGRTPSRDGVPGPAGQRVWNVLNF